MALEGKNSCLTRSSTAVGGGERNQSETKKARRTIKPTAHHIHTTLLLPVMS